ncbi:hypothetical protein K7X08_019514 [Anisodus acutangulus]|uniref:Uncharacterized protein n=1 Tax=Anisodus acutangulus TaxID=402998 RepID=A0A9Q1MV32_9SOLA|nr:hypothetical protein K7X08_019514 [Anisodus acutangulus]
MMVGTFLIKKRKWRRLVILASFSPRWSKPCSESQAPKRLNRSESDSVTPTSPLEDFPIPELDNLRSLRWQNLFGN